MQRTCKVIVFIFTLLALAASAYAQSPREQLQQMVEQLQKTPNDNALREKIIRLATSIKPAPAIPDEANRREGRGKFAFRSAKSNEDFLAAAAEFEEAAKAAPWVAGYYSDLCTIYEKAEKYAEAKRNCVLYLASLADLAQISEVKQRVAGIEFGLEKANSPEARAAKEKEAEQRFIASLEGAKYVCREYRNNDDARHVEIDIRNGKIIGANIVTWINPKLRPGVDYSSDLFVGFRGEWFTGGDIPLQGKVTSVRMLFE
jgi:hypothetical protein